MTRMTSHAALEAHIKGAKTLAPVYIVSSEEILFIQDAADLILGKAKEQGFSEKIIFNINAANQWPELREALQARSLFAEKIILDCRIENLKALTGDAAQTLFAQYAAKLPADKLLFISIGKLTPQQQNAGWIKILEKLGVVVTLWPIALRQFSSWFRGRLQQAGLSADPEALQLLCHYCEGNPLAANQCIQKLKLLSDHPDHHKITAREAASCIAPAARYTVFDLADAVSQKQPARVYTILDGLKAENTEPAIILWALARECRKRAQAEFYPQLAYADKIIKGSVSERAGFIWQYLQQLCFNIAGQKIIEDY